MSYDLLMDTSQAMCVINEAFFSWSRMDWSISKRTFQKMLEPKFFNLFSLIAKGNDEGVDRLIISKDFDFEAFKVFIQRNQLAGTFYPFLSESPSRRNFPDTMIQEFKYAYLMQWSKNEKLLKELEYLWDLLGRAGKEVIFLKGPFLAQRFYGNIDQRSIGDIDILIRMDDFNQIDSLLRQNGYQRRSKVFLNEHLTILFTHHFEYIGNCIVLELHWSLSTHFSFRINYNKIWREKSQFKFNNKSYWVLSDEHELLFQIISIFKDIELKTITLKSFLDTYKILQSVNHFLDWKGFFADRQKEGLYSITINVLDIVLGIMDCYNDFPELSFYVQQTAKEHKSKALNEKLKLLDQNRLSLWNKFWALGLYSAHPLQALVWWALSLPFRLAVYKKA